MSNSSEAVEIIRNIRSTEMKKGEVEKTLVYKCLTYGADVNIKRV